MTCYNNESIIKNKIINFIDEYVVEKADIHLFMHKNFLITLTIDTLFIKFLNSFEVAFFHWKSFRQNQSNSCLHFVDRVQHTQSFSFYTNVF